MPKNKLSSMKDRLLKFIKSNVWVVVEVATMLTLCAMILYGAARAPEFHGHLVRSYVGSKTYMVKDNEKSGGGTGFAVKAPSGQTYILTNDHVCSVSSDGETVLIQNDNGLNMRRRILARADFTDLCLIEGIPNVEGLSVGSEPSIGQIVAAIGHPSLMPITMSRGEVIAPEDIAILEGPISIVDPDTQEETPISEEDGGIAAEDCMQPKHRQVVAPQRILFFVINVKLCIAVTEGAYRTNMLIQPGNSGSPVVDFWGNVVGVAFASDRYGWGIAVSRNDITKFLKNY